MLEFNFHQFHRYLESKLDRVIPERTLRWWLSKVTLIGCKDRYTEADSFWIEEWLRFKRHDRSVENFHNYMRSQYATNA